MALKQTNKKLLCMSFVLFCTSFPLNVVIRAGEMARQLRAWTALP